MADAPHKYLPLFIAEANEHLEQLAGELVRLDGGTQPPGGLWDSIFRHVHSVKGGAATVAESREARREAGGRSVAAAAGRLLLAGQGLPGAGSAGADRPAQAEGAGHLDRDGAAALAADAEEGRRAGGGAARDRQV